MYRHGRADIDPGSGRQDIDEEPIVEEETAARYPEHAELLTKGPLVDFPFGDCLSTPGIITLTGGRVWRDL